MLEPASIIDPDADREARILRLIEIHHPDRRSQRDRLQEEYQRQSRIDHVFADYPLQPGQPFPDMLVLRFVAAYFSIDPLRLVRGDRHHEYSCARAIAATILRTDRHSYSEIAAILYPGTPNHSTAICACTRAHSPSLRDDLSASLTILLAHRSATREVTQ